MYLSLSLSDKVISWSTSMSLGICLGSFYGTKTLSNNKTISAEKCQNTIGHTKSSKWSKTVVWYTVKGSTPVYLNIIDGQPLFNHSFSPNLMSHHSSCISTVSCIVDSGSGSDCFLTAAEPCYTLFGMRPRPPRGDGDGLEPVVLFGMQV